MDEVKRYEFTYTNSFKDKYSADRELDPDGDYVLHADFAKLEAVKDAQAERLERLEGAIDKIERLNLDLGMCYSEAIQAACEAALSPSTTKGE